MKHLSTLILLALLPHLVLSSPTYYTKDSKRTSTTTPSITGLRVVEAGTSGKASPLYTDPFTVCPKDYPNSFNLECVASGDVKRVYITVGRAKTRRESVEPYMAAGDKNGNVYALKGLPDMAKVVCDPEVGKTFEVEVTFKCEEDKKMMPEAKETAEPATATPEPKKTATPAPEKTATPEPEAPKKTATPEPEPPTPAPEKTATPEPDTPAPAPETAAPAPQEPEPEAPEPEAPEPAAGGQCVGTEKDGRIVIDARKGSGLPGKWEENGGEGIVYQPGGGLKGIEKPGTAVIKYQFQAGSNSRYLFTYEVQAPDQTEHNDAFVRFPSGGFTAEKPGDSRKESAGTFLKAYNNCARRCVGGFNVDNDPHTIVTTDALKKGETYTLEMGARSDKFIVYKIILIPCSDGGCFRDDGPYKAISSSPSVTGCL